MHYNFQLQGFTPIHVTLFLMECQASIYVMNEHMHL